MSKKILIIGGTGSLGKKIISRWASKYQLAIYSRDEAKHWTIKNQLCNESITFFVGDIRDKTRLKNVIDSYTPDTVIIAAALKQVDTCELSPLESVKTNLQGTTNVIDAVNNSSVKTVLFISTDKACAPVNVYGMCKALSERLITSQSLTNSNIRWICTRYGNVLESRGSIIPLFKYQIKHANELTVTNPNMTRFLMTLDESVDLIEKALQQAYSGETWIPVLPSMRIGDLAEIFSKISGKSIKIIGERPGEKVHEDLMNSSESIRSQRIIDESGTFIAIKPAYDHGTTKAYSYTSNDNVMSLEQLEDKLRNLNIFDTSLDQFHGRTIEEIRTK